VCVEPENVQAGIQAAHRRQGGRRDGTGSAEHDQTVTLCGHCENRFLHNGVRVCQITKHSGFGRPVHGDVAEIDNWPGQRGQLSGQTMCPHSPGRLGDCLSADRCVLRVVEGERDAEQAGDGQCIQPLDGSEPRVRSMD
jgi:hypothetical protein